MTTRKEKAETIQPSSQQRATNNINALVILSLKILPKEARASFRPSELFTKTERHTNKMKEGPRPVKAQKCSKCTKKSKDSVKPAKSATICGFRQSLFFGLFPTRSPREERKSMQRTWVTRSDVAGSVVHDREGRAGQHHEVRDPVSPLLACARRGQLRLRRATDGRLVERRGWTVRPGAHPKADLVQHSTLALESSDSVPPRRVHDDSEVPAMVKQRLLTAPILPEKSH